jgi:glucokinase
MPANGLVLGVDIGGTKVATGLVSSTGEILFKTRVAMKSNGTAQEAMDCVHAAIRIALEHEMGEKVFAIGVASPGPLALPAGVVIHTPNLPCWINFPLGDEVRRVYGLPTFVDNDANAAGFAEAHWGAGSDSKRVFYATLGTGIGTAIISDGHIFYGRTGTAPEGGHMSMDIHAPRTCGCGKPGCLEALASGPAIARRARERVMSDSDAEQILATWKTDAAAITARTVANMWRAGDPVATEILRETADLLSVWLGNVIDLLDPDVIVIGGGLGNMVAGWFDYIGKKLPTCSIIPDCVDIPIRLAKYGSDAGIAGAAALAFSQVAAGERTHLAGAATATPYAPEF